MSLKNWSERKEYFKKHNSLGDTMREARQTVRDLEGDFKVLNKEGIEKGYYK